MKRQTKRQPKFNIYGTGPTGTEELLATVHSVGLAYWFMEKVAELYKNVRSEEA
jgi:hypothetical protein